MYEIYQRNCHFKITVLYIYVRHKFDPPMKRSIFIGLES